MSITAVVGAQYGSEGKGVVVKEIAGGYKHHVRTGGPNAGHSFHHRGRVWKMQSVPCGWTNPAATLYFGPGGVISPEQLRAELTEVAAADPSVLSRLVIDFRCGVLSGEHHRQEGGVAGDMHRDIGSTGEGVGAARLARISRRPEAFQTFEMIPDFELCRGLRVRDCLGDVPELLHEALGVNDNILLEGTQGFGLSLLHGPWPKVTSADTTAAQLCADAGVSPRHLKNILLVARTMPIRVAGNSGPLPGETTWESLSARLGRQVEERTTVTKKIRRIGEWDDALFERAAYINGATEIALTFMDYLNPADHGKTRWEDLSAQGKEFVEHVQSLAGVRATMLGTGFSEAGGWSCISR